MPLPRTDLPIVKIRVPSLGRERKFRPFTVKEEKLLFTAKSSGDRSDVLLAVKQVIANCSLDGLDVEKLAIFDVEYLFLKLRSFSVGEVLTLTYTDAEDRLDYSVEVNLDEVEVSGLDEKRDMKILLGNDSGVELRYPPAEIYGSRKIIESPNPYDAMFQVIKSCIASAWQGEQVYDSFTDEEFEEWIEGLDVKTRLKLQDFLDKMPRMQHSISYKTKAGTERTITLSSLSDFFSYL